MQARILSLIPFVPSGPAFDKALAFFSALGFAQVWNDGQLACLRSGAATFFLQKIDVPVWQENQMLTIEVDDLDLYWEAISAYDLPAAFPGVRLQSPKDFPWGREIHIIDPSGVCWHIRQPQHTDSVPAPGSP